MCSMASEINLFQSPKINLIDDFVFHHRSLWMQMVAPCLTYSLAYSDDRSSFLVFTGFERVLLDHN